MSVDLGNKIWPKDAQATPVVEVSCPLSGYHSQTSVTGAELMLEDQILTSESTKSSSSSAGKELGPFTIILTDPDAPSRKNPKWGEMCHWIASLPTPAESSAASSAYFELPSRVQFENPAEIVPYKAPGPPPKTGYHRYVFLLFTGDNSNLTAPAERQHWGMGEMGHGVKDWAKMEGLKVVGANFFFARDKRQ